MRARGYLRESTERQGERFGPDAQRAAIRRACAELGLELDEARWYVDLVSGTGKVVRDELARALADADGGELEVLVCYDTSRFARNERDAFSFEERFHRAGARVYFALERIWADDEDQAMPKGIFHVINAEYSRKLSRRIRDALASKKIRGGHVGGIPWGYRLSADKMRLEPSSAEHAVRLLAWELYAGGTYTTATLAAELNGRGHRITWKGRTRPFTKWTLTEIFRSRVDLEVGGLDTRTHARVVELLDRRRTAHDKVAQRRHQYLFASVARCAECGERFWGRASVNRHKPRTYLQLKHPRAGAGAGSATKSSSRPSSARGCSSGDSARPSAQRSRGTSRGRAGTMREPRRGASSSSLSGTGCASSTSGATSRTTSTRGSALDSRGRSRPRRRRSRSRRRPMR